MKPIELPNLSDRGRRRLVMTTRIVAPLAVLLLGVALLAILMWTGPQVDTSQGLRRPPQVLVFEARPVPVRRQWRGYGIVEAKTVADVPARVTATVLEVPDAIEPGASVEKGQLLIRLDPSDFQRRVESAEQALAQIAAQAAQLSVEEAALRERLALERRDVALAQAELARLRTLFEGGAANQQDLDRAERATIDAGRRQSQTAEALNLIAPRRQQLEAQRTAQQSALRLARQDLERSTIAAPIAGVLQAVDVEVGESVAAGQRVARVVDPAVIEVPIRLPAGARRSIAVGDEVVVAPTSGDGEPCFAVITRMTPENDPGSRSMTAYVTVDQTRFDQGARLAPGAFVSAAVTSGEAQERWVVPRRSVRAGRVLLVDDSVVHSAPVTVDFPLENGIEALGLPDQQWAVLRDFPGRPGQLVMVNASQSVMDGQRVEPVRTFDKSDNRPTSQAGASASPSAPSSADLPPSEPGGAP